MLLTETTSLQTTTNFGLDRECLAVRRLRNWLIHPDIHLHEKESLRPDAPGALRKLQEPVEIPGLHRRTTANRP